MVLVAPVAVEVRVRRNGVPGAPSLTIAALTPMPARLMASRMPCSELLELSITSEVVAWAASGAKLAPEYTPLARVPPLTVPNWNEMVVGVPAPTLEMVLAWPADDNFCAFARLLTVMS